MKTYTLELAGHYNGPDEKEKDETISVKVKGQSMADALGHVVDQKVKVPRLTKGGKVVDRALDTRGEYKIKQAYTGNGEAIIRFPELMGRAI